MTLDEAILHAVEVCCGDGNQCSVEHAQLAHWLKDYKRLLAKESNWFKLKIAINDKMIKESDNVLGIVNSRVKRNELVSVLALMEQLENSLK